MFAKCGKTGIVSLRVNADLRRGPRTGEARQRETIGLTLGRFPELSLDAARAEAMRLLAEIKAGRDPRAVPIAKVWTVERMFEEYAKDLATLKRAKQTIADFRKMLVYMDHWESLPIRETPLAQRKQTMKENGPAVAHALDDWRPLPITAITKEMARDRHRHLTAVNGPVVANHALKAFRTCFNFAKKVHSEPLGENPINAVTFTPERSANRSIEPVDLAGWYGKLQRIENPLRRLMHEIGLFSGLRPSNLVALERAWIAFDRSAIIIPAAQFKGRVEFHLPLSGYLVGLLQRALVLSRETANDAPWVFPTRSRNGQQVIASQVWKEKVLPSETGHMLRHTYSNMVHLAGVDDVDRELLLGHKVPGVKGTYLHVPTLFSRLLEQQEKVSAHMLKLIGVESPGGTGRKASKKARKRRG